MVEQVTEFSKAHEPAPRITEIDVNPILILEQTEQLIKQWIWIQSVNSSREIRFINFVIGDFYSATTGKRTLA